MPKVNITYSIGPSPSGHGANVAGFGLFLGERSGAGSCSFLQSTTPDGRPAGPRVGQLASSEQRGQSLHAEQCVLRTGVSATPIPCHDLRKEFAV